jgi:uncharacterized protein (DUF4415 family)
MPFWQRSEHGAGRSRSGSLYLDADVLAWFKQEPRYQKEINRALWKAMREEGRESLE